MIVGDVLKTLSNTTVSYEPGAAGAVESAGDDDALG
jgi:hypothetical protein